MLSVDLQCRLNILNWPAMQTECTQMTSSEDQKHSIDWMHSVDLQCRLNALDWLDALSWPKEQSVWLVAILLPGSSSTKYNNYCNFLTTNRLPVLQPTVYLCRIVVVVVIWIFNTNSQTTKTNASDRNVLKAVREAVACLRWPPCRKIIIIHNKHILIHNLSDIQFNTSV